MKQLISRFLEEDKKANRATYEDIWGITLGSTCSTVWDTWRSAYDAATNTAYAVFHDKCKVDPLYEPSWNAAFVTFYKTQDTTLALNAAALYRLIRVCNKHVE